MATLSAKEAARELGTDARTLRKFLRAITPKEDQPGQGNRYHIEEKTIPKLKKQFADWSKPKTKPSDNGAEAEAIEDFDEDLITEEELDASDDEFDEEDVPDFSASDEDVEDAEDFDLEEL